MKTRAYDEQSQKWRRDYVVSPDGNVFRTVALDNDKWILQKVEWQLARFTGLEDIAEVEVYEHHVMKDRSGATFVVIWDKKQCRFMLQSLKAPFVCEMRDELIKRMKVVGNIFSSDIESAFVTR
jgi:hypothetical protein